MFFSRGLRITNLNEYTNYEFIGELVFLGMGLQITNLNEYTYYEFLV